MTRVALAAVALVAAVVAAPKALGFYSEVKRASGPLVITSDPGGSIFEYMERYEDLRRSGRLVVIDGICISACTLITGMVPSDRVCATPFAKLAFHSATRGPFYSREGTRLMWQIYPEQVRAMLIERGWDGDAPDPKVAPPPVLKKGGKSPPAGPAVSPLRAPGEHPELIYIDGADLHSIYKAC